MENPHDFVFPGSDMTPLFMREATQGPDAPLTRPSTGRSCHAQGNSENHKRQVAR